MKNPHRKGNTYTYQVHNFGASKFDFVFKNVPFIDGRIVGGEPTTIEQHPYQISVQLLQSDWCGGSINSDRYIVSAAHCFSWPTSWYGIRAGSSFHNSGGQVIAVSTITIHPNYNPSTADNDISIIFLASALTFGSGVTIISLPTQNQYVAEGTRAIVTGWGDLQEDGPAPIQLQVVGVPIVSNARCAALYSALGWGVTDNMLCAGYDEGGRDACQGDSGGLLTINGTLIAVVSWGEGCAQPGFPGVYASVPYLRGFITSITGI
ncbi:polyserase-related [Holotrichia oblita]|uniref:Polyserase-related n=1 Tax=Holotrichia oblita TaxID=644536 RepID=A0ACB9SYM3_HOLOL|nr:polyserase-related [Holotrichia oblita]